MALPWQRRIPAAGQSASKKAHQKKAPLHSISGGGTHSSQIFYILNHSPRTNSSNLFIQLSESTDHINLIYISPVASFGSKLHWSGTLHSPKTIPLKPDATGDLSLKHTNELTDQKLQRKNSLSLLSNSEAHPEIGYRSQNSHNQSSAKVQGAYGIQIMHSPLRWNPL